MSPSELPLSKSVAPANVAEVAEVIRAACRDPSPIYPLGGGTSLGIGLPARKKGIGLSTTNLLSVVDYPARDMTITVEAGIRMARLAELLGTERQRLPIDVPQAEQATLGGVIATNWSGPRRFGHGTIRDYVIGISAVDGLGTPFKAGGRVVKNVAGYDLCKLLCGSLGTLAVITQVTLKLKPMPAATAFLVAHTSNLAEADRLLAALVDSRTTPAAVELLVGSHWRQDALLNPAGAAIGPQLAVGLEGTATEVDWMLSQLRQEWQQLGIERIVTPARDKASDIWQRLAEFPAETSEALVIKANLLPSAVTRFVERLLEAAPEASVQSHAASGIVLARIAGLTGGEITQLLTKQLQPMAMSAGGNVVVLASPDGVESTRRLVWGGARGDAPLMQAVKNQFDPHGLLNPGRFVYPNA
jgi:glycolate oxidase FAD binding subunit